MRGARYPVWEAAAVPPISRVRRLVTTTLVDVGGLAAALTLLHFVFHATR